MDTGACELGTDLAATPGKVVYRNRLMELIQLEPRTKTVYEIPVLLSPPWINKYYIMDLAPGKSFAEWALDHGHTVFCISYRASTVAPLVKDQPVSVPFEGPAPKEIVANSVGFAEKLLASQKAFAEKVIATSAPVFAAPKST